MSGKALASGFPADPEPVASAILLSYFFADPSVVYMGHRYPLYRRYAGKAVTVIEDGDVIRFSIEGRMLSKTFPRAYF